MANPAQAADHASGGLPQFDLAQWPGQMVWMLLIFGLLFLLFRYVFVPSGRRHDRRAGGQDRRRHRRRPAQPP